MSRQKQELEKVLIDSAKKIIFQHGLSGLSARAVAAASGCSVGTLYNYFRNMDDLIIRINAGTLLALKEALLVVSHSAPIDKTLGKVITKRYLGFVKENQAYWNLIYDYKLPKGQELPEWYQKLVDDIFNIMQEALKPLLSNDPIAAYRATRVLWAGFHGIFMLEITGKLNIAHKESSEDLCESLFDNYLRGWR